MKVIHRVYILIDLVEGKTEQIIDKLKGQSGIKTIDLLEGSPKLIISIEAKSRQHLAQRTIRILASTDDMIEDQQLLPVRTSEIPPVKRCTL